MVFLYLFLVGQPTGGSSLGCRGASGTDFGCIEKGYTFVRASSLDKELTTKKYKNKILIVWYNLYIKLK